MILRFFVVGLVSLRKSFRVGPFPGGGLLRGGAAAPGPNPNPSGLPFEVPSPFSLPPEFGLVTAGAAPMFSIMTRVTCWPVITWKFSRLTYGSKYVRRASDRVWLLGSKSVGTNAAPAEVPSFGSNSVGTPR